MLILSIRIIRERTRSIQLNFEQLSSMLIQTRCHSRYNTHSCRSSSSKGKAITNSRNVAQNLTIKLRPVLLAKHISIKAIKSRYFYIYKISSIQQIAKDRLLPILIISVSKPSALFLSSIIFNLLNTHPYPPNGLYHHYYRHPPS